MMMFRNFRNQIVNITAYSGIVVAGFAITDYNREVLRANSNLSYTIPKEYLANKLEILHEEANTDNLKYCNIVAYRHLCLELHNLYLIASRNRQEIILDQELMDHELIDDEAKRKNPKLLKNTEEECKYANILKINELTTRNNTIITMQMCRRAMLRNGFYVMWFKTFIGRFQTFILSR
jgi:hypothetical protein